MLFRPARGSDIDEICTLLATSRQSPDHLHALFRADPHFDPAQIRIAWTAGHIVGCAKIYPRVLRIDTATIAAGGIGNVRTDPRYWQKGIATALLNECLSAMYLEGITLAPLFARRHTLFARRGWHAIPEVGLEIPTEAFATAFSGSAPTARVRPLEANDIDALMELHESSNAARTGTAARDRDDWFGCLTTLDLHGAMLLVALRKDEIVGYTAAIPHGTHVDVLELLLAPWAEDAWAPLLRAVAAKAGNAVTLAAGLPADYRRLVCERLGAQATLVACDELMLRIVDPTQLLGELQPLLAARLRTAGAAEPLAVRIGPLRGGAVLCADHNGVAVKHPRRDDPYILPEGVFLELLLGAESAQAALDALDFPAPVCEMLRCLFPQQDWVFWRADAF